MEDVCCSRFFATTRKKRSSSKTKTMKSEIVCFARKRYTVTVNGITLVSPLGFVPTMDYCLIFAQCTVNWRKIHGIPLFSIFEKRQRIFARNRYTVTVSVSPSCFFCALNRVFAIKIIQPIIISNLKKARFIPASLLLCLRRANRRNSIRSQKIQISYRKKEISIGIAKHSIIFF